MRPARVHNYHLHAVQTGKNADSGSAVQNIPQHLSGHFLRKGTDALFHDAVIPGSDNNEGRFHTQRSHASTDHIQTCGYIFKTAEAAFRFGQIVKMRSGDFFKIGIHPMNSGNALRKFRKFIKSHGGISSLFQRISMASP